MGAEYFDVATTILLSDTKLRSEFPSNAGLRTITALFTHPRPKAVSHGSKHSALLRAISIKVWADSQLQGLAHRFPSLTHIYGVYKVTKPHGMDANDFESVLSALALSELAKRSKSHDRRMAILNAIIAAVVAGIVSWLTWNYAPWSTKPPETEPAIVDALEEAPGEPESARH